LDLNYSKYLQYYNTLIILITTYFIAAFLAVLTKQISIFDTTAFIIFIIVSFVAVNFLLLFIFNDHLKQIPEEIKNL